MRQDDVMLEIKENVKTVAVEHTKDIADLDQRVTDIERGASGERKRKYLDANGKLIRDPDDMVMKLALANCLQRDGVVDNFERVGLGSAEKKLVLEYTKKSMDTGTGGAGGGYVLPPQYVAALIEMLRSKLVVVQAGATMMLDLHGSPVMIPKQLTGSTVYWVGQNATLTASDPTWGQVQLTPKTMAIRSQYSNLLGILSNPAIESIIRKDFAKVAALELDRVSLRGSGAANQPLGVNGVGSINTYTIGSGNGGDWTRQDALKQYGQLEDANALGSKMAFITSPKVNRVLKNERIAQYSGETLGTYQYYPLTDAQLGKTLDCPIFTTTQIPVNLTTGSSTDCSEIYLGNWEELLIGMFGSVEVLATNVGGNAWSQNAIEVRLILNCDVQVRHPESFSLCTSARTNNA